MSLLRRVSETRLSRRDLLRSAAAGGVGLAGLYLAGCDDDEPGPDLIYHNADVLTVDAANPSGTAVAIREGRIVAAGDDEAVLALAGSQTKRIDLGGLTLMPGIVDPHSHILNTDDGRTLAEKQDFAFENGITALGNLYSDRDFLHRMQLLNAKDELRLRTTLYLSRHTACGEDNGNWYQEFPPEVEPEAMLRIAGAKLFADGGSCGLVAVTQPERDVGDLWFTQEQMNDAVEEAQALGYQVVIHAMGDRAVEQAQNAIEAALAGGPNTPRHRIDHNNVIRPDLLPRYAEIGIVPIIWSYSRACTPGYIGELLQGPDAPPDWKSWLAPYRDLLDTGVEHVAWHGDWPSNPANPFLHLFGMVTGKAVAVGEDLVAVDDSAHEPGTVCDPPDWALEQTLTVDEALRMMTTEAAYALGQESVIGSLESGKLADLVVLSANPRSVEPDDLKNIQVRLTMVGGDVLYCGAGAETLCPASG